VPHLLRDVQQSEEDEAMAQSPSLQEVSTCAGDDVQIGVIVVVESASYDGCNERKDDEHEYEDGDEERGGRGPDVQARLAAGSGSSRPCAGDGKAAGSGLGRARGLTTASGGVAAELPMAAGVLQGLPRLRAGGGRQVSARPSLTHRQHGWVLRPHTTHNARRSGEQTLLDREREMEKEKAMEKKETQEEDITTNLKWGYRSQET
jgi:hypothetical protein